jgi:hypothetical protein
MAIDYKQIIGESVRRLSDLMRRRRKLDADILRLQRLVRRTVRVSESHLESSTSPAVPIYEITSTGVTDAVRQVLMTYGIWLTPVLIRDLLPTVGFDTSLYRNPLISIHAILRRLILSGEVIRGKQPAGGTAYLWAGSSGKNRQHLAV